MANKRYHKKLLDDRGWMVPGDGTVMRLVYEGMVSGLGTADIAERIGRSKGSVAVLSHRIRSAWKLRPDWFDPPKHKQIL